MAIYRNIQMSFWTDSKVSDDLTPEDRYFYLYLLTNPHTNLAGCYELSAKQAAYETGYNKETVERLFDRFEKMHIAVYSKDTKEVLLVNWHKYNWTSSEKFRKALEWHINEVKNKTFREYLTAVFEREDDSVLIPYPYGSDTTVTVTVTDTVTDTVVNNITKGKPQKHRYGEYNNVLLTDEELEKLKKEFPDWKERIENLSEYVASTGKSYKSHLATIRAWARKDKKVKPTKFSNAPERNQDWDFIEQEWLKRSMGK